MYDGILYIYVETIYIIKIDAIHTVHTHTHTHIQHPADINSNHFITVIQKGEIARSICRHLMAVFLFICVQIASILYIYPRARQTRKMNVADSCVCYPPSLVVML